MKPDFLPWLGGFLDAEGCLGAKLMKQAPGTLTVSPTIQVSQHSLYGACLDEVRASLGFGRCYVNRKGVRVWQTTSLAEVDRLLDLVQPFLVEKVRQAGILRRIRQVQTAAQQTAAYTRVIRRLGETVYTASEMHQLVDLALACNPKRSADGLRYGRGRSSAALHALVADYYDTDAATCATSLPAYQQPISIAAFPAWLAGFFDGDGCASIGVAVESSAQGRYLTYTKYVSIAQHKAYAWVLQLIQKQLQFGAVYRKSWQIGSSAEIAAFIELVRPHVRVKGAQLDLMQEALHLLATREERTHIGAPTLPRGAAFRIAEIAGALNPHRRGSGRYGGAMSSSDLGVLTDQIYSQAPHRYARTRVDCAWCGTSKEVYLSAVRTINYCDQRCAGYARTAAYAADPAAAPGWRRAVERVAVSCAECGKEVLRTPYQAARRDPTKKFCSRACADTANGRRLAEAALVTKLCRNCLKPFTNAASRIGSYCSKSCATVVRSAAAHARGSEQRTCRHCSQPFTCRKSVERVFCSKLCLHESARATTTCQHCHKEFRVSKSKVRAFCGHSCSTSARHAARRGSLTSTTC